MGGWVTQTTTQRSTSENKANLQIQRTRVSVQGVQIKSVTPKDLPLPLHEIEQTLRRVTGLQRVEGNSNSRHQVVLAKDPSYSKTQPGPNCTSTDVEPAAPETQPLQLDHQVKDPGPDAMQTGD